MKRQKTFLWVGLIKIGNKTKRVKLKRMKQLISLISTEGKTAAQISTEAKQAWEKYSNEMKNQTINVNKPEKEENQPKNKE